MYNCKYCGKECKNEISLRHHENCCKHRPDYNPEAYRCEFCGRTFARLTSFKSHIKVCKSNPNRLEGNYHPWNRGLTKETN